MSADRSGQGGILSRDTDRLSEARQIQAWRALSTVERARVITGACRAVRTLALAGLRTRDPAASERELIARLADLTLGSTLARRVYPELTHLEP
jgi:hypothetical protein